MTTNEFQNHIHSSVSIVRPVVDLRGIPPSLCKEKRSCEELLGIERMYKGYSELVESY